MAAEFQGTSTSVAQKHFLFLAFRLGVNFYSRGRSVILVTQTRQIYALSFTSSAGIHSGLGHVIAQVIKQQAWGHF